MKNLRKRLCSVCLASFIVLGTALAAAPGPAQAASWTNKPAQNGKVYNVIKHFLTHVANRDKYTFYDTIPCTRELRECIGYLLDAYQSQGVDLISYFNLHWSASYPYANVRNFCAQLDKLVKPGSTVTVPCGSTGFTFLFKKYKNADAAYADGAFNTAGTIGLLTSPTEQYGHCWISLGAFDPYVSEYDMRVFLENYYGLGANALSGKLATGDANKVWKGYGNRGVWRVHATRWSEGVHGGCAVDNGAASESLKNAPCYVLIPAADIVPQSAPSTQPSQPSQPAQPTEPTEPAKPVQPMGDLSVQLVSSRPEMTGGNPNYSLSGVKVGVYADAACTRELVAFPTDANGHVTIQCYAPQTVYVKLKSAAPGYESPNARSAVITEDKTTELSLSLSPERIAATISVQPQPASAPTAGAVFTFRHYACTELSAVSDKTLNGVWTMTMGESGAVFSRDTTEVVQAPKGTDGYYPDDDGRIIFPLGFITIEQTGAAEGQSLDGVWAVCGSTLSGKVPEASASAQDGSNAPVISFTSSYQSLQSFVSDGTTAYLTSVTPAAAVSDGAQPLCFVTTDQLIIGLRFGTDASQNAKHPGLSPLTSCSLLSAGGNARPEGSPMQTGDILRVRDDSGALCFEGSVLIFGEDGSLSAGDLIRVRDVVLGDAPLPDVFPETAGGRASDLFRNRSRILGSGSVFQAAP